MFPITVQISVRLRVAVQISIGTARAFREGGAWCMHRSEQRRSWHPLSLCEVVVYYTQWLCIKHSWLCITHRWLCIKHSWLCTVPNLYTTLLIFGSKTRKTDAFNPLLILKTQPKHEAIHNLLCTFLVHTQPAVYKPQWVVYTQGNTQWLFLIHSGCS